jgi:hypothetical protein
VQDSDTSDRRVRGNDNSFGLAWEYSFFIIDTMPLKRTSNSSNKTGLPGNLSDEDVYKMIMLHRYQRKTCEQLAQQFGITRSQAYDLIARRQVGGCCG